MSRGLFFFALIAGAFTVLRGADNLIPNPQFELNPATGLPSGWLLSEKALGEVTDGPHGGKALRLIGRENGEMIHWKHFVRIEMGKSYQLKGRFRADKGTQIQVYTECNGPWKCFSTNWQQGTGEWSDFRIPEIRFAEKGEKSQIYIVCALKNAGTADFAELTLTETLPGSPNLVKNADFFERGKNGLPKFWSVGKGAQVSLEAGEGGTCFFLSSPPAGKNASVLQHGIRILPDCEYQLTVRVKGSCEAEFGAYLECSAPVFQTKAMPWKKCSGDWQTRSFRFNFRNFKGLPYLVLRIRGAGTVRIADPVIQEVPGVLKNGDFTRDTLGWSIAGGKILTTDSGGVRVLELNSGKGAASARQCGISVRKGQSYELRYSVRGGSDKTHRDSQNAVWFRAVPVMDGKILGNAAFQDSFDAWQRKSVAFQAPADGVIDILLEVKEPYCADFTKIELAEVKNTIPPLILLADGSFAYRSGVYSSNRDVPKAGFTLVNNTVHEAASYLVEFNGNVFELQNTGNISFDLDVPQIPGTYPVLVTAKDAEGRNLVSVSLPFRVNPPAPREVTFRKDHVMLIDGKPFFPLGVWSVSGKKSSSEKARLISESGFNIALANTDTIDAYAEYGMMVLLSVLNKLPQFQDPAHFKRWDAQYRKALAKQMKHPSLVGYFNIDEPGWRGVPVKSIQDAYDYIRSIDPYRPVMLNEAPRGAVSEIRPYSLACDAYGVDIYPVPEPNAHSGLDDKNLTCVGKYADRCREVVYDRKPVWMTLQAFAWGHITRKEQILPTLQQSRFMAYNAVTHGATGLFWWGINHGKEDWDYVRELGTLIRELRAMSSVFVGETLNSDLFQTDSPEIRILHKKADGKNWFIAVNESYHEVKAVFRNAEDRALRVFFEDRTVMPENGVLQETFKPYDVHVYGAAETLPPPLEIPATHRTVPKQDLPDDYLTADWIWYPGKSKVVNHRAYFKREFTLDSIPEKALVFATADDWFRMYINGHLFMEHYKDGHSWNNISFRDAVPFLKQGRNMILIKAMDGGGAPCGVLYAAHIQQRDGTTLKLISDTGTMASEDGKSWVHAEFLSHFGDAPWHGSGEPQATDTDLLDAYGFPF